MCLFDKEKSKWTKARNDGGPLEQPKQMISADSPATPTTVQVPNLILKKICPRGNNKVVI